MKTYKSKIVRYKLIEEPTDIYKCKLVRSKEVYEYVLNFYEQNLQIFESLYMLMLNRANNSIGYILLSQGGVAGTVIDIKLLCKYAVDSLASNIILIHNHPSGNMAPSEGDNMITKKAKEALEILDIKLLDHLIVTVDGYYSYADEDKII